MASLRFTVAEDGMVDVALALDQNESSVSPAAVAAYAYGRRGLTKRETERYKVRGFFTITPEVPAASGVCFYHMDKPRPAVVQVLFGTHWINVCAEDERLYDAIDVNDPESNVREKGKRPLTEHSTPTPHPAKSDLEDRSWPAS